MHLKKCKIIVLQSNMYMTQMLKGLDELIFGNFFLWNMFIWSHMSIYNL